MATDGITTLSSPVDELAQLRQENELLRAERRQFLDQQTQSARTIEQLQHQLQSLLRRLYGRSAEKIDPQQMQLFETLLNQLAAPSSAVAQTPVDPAEPAPAAPRTATNGHGRRRLPSDLPRQKILHDLSEDQKPCPCCGQMRHVIGQEVSEQLDYVPAKLTVIEHVRLTYACRHCEQTAAEGGSQVVTADKPASPIEKGLAAPGLLSYVMVSKYSDHCVQGKAVPEMREDPSRPGCRIRPQTSSNCGDQESSWETSSANGAAGPRQVRFAKTNASEPLRTCRKSIQTMSKPGSGGCSGRGDGDTCLRPSRHPALRRRECESGSGTEPWNLSSRCQGRSPSGHPARTRVPMRGTGAERLVVAMKGV